MRFPVVLTNFISISSVDRVRVVSVPVVRVGLRLGPGLRGGAGADEDVGGFHVHVDELLRVDVPVGERRERFIKKNNKKTRLLKSN